MALSQLVSATSIHEVKGIRDKAECVRQYARNAKLSLEIQNQAAELKLRAERRAGALLSAMRLRGGDRKSKSRHATLKHGLENLGLTKHQSYRWQRIASIPDEDFELWLESRKSSGKEVTSAGLMRWINGQQAEKKGAKANAHKGSRLNEKLDELQNHAESLERILLGPLTSEEPYAFKTIERRTIQRLLREFTSLVSGIASDVESLQGGNALD